MGPLKCIYCNEIKKSLPSLKQHELRCKRNPNRIKPYLQDWTEERRARHSIIMKEKNTNSNRIFSAEVRRKISECSRVRNNKYYSDPKNRKRHSDIMKEAVKNYPDSYSASNISGRTKTVEYNGFKLKGS